jgi:methylmalonyl-CoA mutase N-terminal domain/subunit
MADKYKERKENFETLSWIPLKRVYNPDDIVDIDYERDIGEPGEYPFTRGIHPTMYRGRFWVIRQIAGFGSPEATNERYKYLIKAGQTGINYIEDQATKMGVDSDDSKAKGEIGREGIPVDSLEDMDIAFNGIPKNISVTLVTNHLSIFAMYLVAREKQGIDIKDLRGTIRNDPFTVFNGTKLHIYPPEPSVKMAVDIVEFCVRHLPLYNATSITGQHFREAGSTAVQEMAFAIADAMALTEAVLQKGIDIDTFAPMISFYFDIMYDFFEEIAKFRAGRNVWARVMKEKFKARNPESWKARFAAQTAGSALTSQQPLNNIARVGFQALSGVLGGIQSMHTTSFDEVYALPTEKAAKIAVRTQQILQHEIGVADVVDPLGGSYFVERLTKDMEEMIWEEIKKLEDMGGGSILQGVLKATEDGYFQAEFTRSSVKYQKEVESGKRVIVGVNKFVDEEDPGIEILKVPLTFQEEKIKRLRALKASRDKEKVRAALDKIKETAIRGDNLMYPILDAVKLYVTEGEITDALKEVYGEYREKPIF